MASNSYKVEVTLTDGTKVNAGDVVVPISHVIGVKGNNETTYRKGQVNLTPENIGAAKDTELTAETERAIETENHLQEQIDEFSAGKVVSVNGQTGAVSLSASDIGALPTSGGALTGGLGVQTIAQDGTGHMVVDGNAHVYDTGQRVYSPNNPNMDLLSLNYIERGTYTLPNMNVGQIFLVCASLAKNVHLKFSDNVNQTFAIVLINNNNVSWEFNKNGDAVFLSNVAYTSLGSFCIVKRMT